MTYAELEADLRARWLPSAEQMKMADALLAAGYDQERDGRDRGVYTAHLLLGKEYGIWTADIVVVPLDGVFLTREAASQACVRAVEMQRSAGITATGGYAWHMRVGEAAVWEDIMTWEKGS